MRLAREKQISRRSAKIPTEKESVEAAAERAEADKLWSRQLIVTSAYFPLTVHWSLESGVLNDWLVGLFGTIAGGVRFIPLWRE